MGLFSGIRNLARTVIEYGRNTNNPRVAAVGRTMAGVRITPDNAVTISAVWACLRYLSQTVAGLPWHVMRDGPNGASIVSKNTPDFLIYKRPNKEWSSFQFRETLTHWALRWGNGYAEIERDQAGRPFAMWPIHPERVQVCRDPETQQIYYEVTGSGGAKIEIDAMDMFHIRGFGEGVVGVNVVEYAAQSLGWAQAAQLFGAAFFGNGANVSGIVAHKKKLTAAGLARVKGEFEQLYKGIKNSHGTVHTDTDAEFRKIGLDAKETQLVEVHYFLIEEVCRWFGVPPHKVAHLLRSTFSNIEHQAIEVVVDSITPWVKRFEDEADYKLFGEANRQNLYTKMNMKALMRGDAAGRIAYLEGMWRMGAYNANKVLEVEDENGIGPDGDHYFVQSGYVPASIAANPPLEPTPAPKPALKQQIDDMPDDALSESASIGAARVAAMLELA
jgi:HK97 family phage portal protein